MAEFGSVGSNTAYYNYDYSNRDKKDYEQSAGAYMASNVQSQQLFGDNTGVHLTDEQRTKSIFC